MEEEKDKKCKLSKNMGGCNAVYGIGLIGAFVFYIQHSDSLLMVILGILKAIVWPAMLVYKLLEMFY
jgi:hypothetical protein